MLNKLLQNKSSIFFLIGLVYLLILIRVFESQLFYDPFLIYFKGDYQNMPLPEFNGGLVFLGLLFRFSLNAALSLGILYFLFKDKEMISFATILYVLLFLILIVAFFFYCLLF